MSTASSLESHPQTLAPKPARPTHDPRMVAAGRALFAFLGAVSPAAGAWLAERAFVSPRRIAAPSHEIAVRDAADETFTIHHEGLNLDALRWGDGPRTVLLAHGWEGRGTQMGRFVAPLLESGFRVVTFDGPAHGRSPGKQTELMHFSRVFGSVAEAVGPIHGVISHSFGAAACAMALAHGTFQTQRLVMVGSPARLMYPMGQFRSVLNLPDSIWLGFLARMERRLGFHPEHLDLAALALKVTIPRLIIHCEDDTEVLYENAERIRDAWPDAAHLPTQGLGHRRILKDPDVIAAAVDFMKQ